MIAKVVTLAQRNVAATVLIVLAVILLAASYMFYTGGQVAADDLGVAEDDLKMAQMELTEAQITYNVSELTNQRYDLTGDVAVAKSVNKFPEEIDRDQLELDLANEATKRGVTLVSFSQSAIGEETIGSNTYNRSEIKITINGMLNNTSLFLTSMEKGDFPTLKFKSVSSSKDTEGGKWTTTLTLVVLSQI